MKTAWSFLKDNPVMMVFYWGAVILAALALPLLFF